MLMKYCMLVDMVNSNFVGIMLVRNQIQFREYGKFHKYIAIDFIQDIPIDKKDLMINDFKNITNFNRKRPIRQEDFIKIVDKYTTQDNIKIRYCL